MTDPFARAARRALRRNGKPVTLETPQFETDADGDVVYDDQGDPAPAGSATTTTHAELVPRGSPRFERFATGGEREIDAMAWVPDTVTDDLTLTAGENDVEQPATELVADWSGRYQVVHVHHEGGGRIRLACRRLGPA